MILYLSQDETKNYDGHERRSTRLRKDTKIPGIVGYVVKEGDTLWSIAKTYFTTVESIREQNEEVSEIKPGDKLLIVKEIGIFQ